MRDGRFQIADLFQEARLPHCWRKEAHATSAAAEAARDAVLAEGRAKDPATIRAYRCWNHGDEEVWHVGHPRPGSGR